MRRPLALFLVFLAALAGPSRAHAQTWTPLPDGFPRVYQRAIYDSLRTRMLVFGGADSLFEGDVHALSLSGPPGWSEVLPSGTPPHARDAHGQVYDPVRDRMLIFGGAYVFGITQLEYNDVWAMSLGPSPAWTQLAPTGTKPAQRHAHCMIYDPVRDRLVIFGGRDVIGDRNDVWELPLSTLAWNQLTPSGTPPTAREHAAAIYDPVRDRMIVYGGFDGKPTWNGDVWELTFSPLAWNKITPVDTGPGARDRHSAVYDPVNDRMVIFGGRTGSGTWGNDVWALSLGGTPSWLPITPPGTLPPARWGHSGIYDAVNRQMVIFGGSATAGFHYADAWALPLGPVVAVGDAPGTASRLSWIGAGPNPARGNWSVDFRTRDAGTVSLRLYDTAGRVVRELWNGSLGTGSHSLHWDLRSDAGRRVPSGIYFCDLRGAGGRLTRPLVVLAE